MQSRGLSHGKQTQSAIRTSPDRQRSMTAEKENSIDAGGRRLNNSP